MSKAEPGTLDALHGALAEALALKIREGTATAADLAVARQFLKDNGVDAIPRGPKSPMGDLIDSLPDFDDDEQHTYKN